MPILLRLINLSCQSLNGKLLNSSSICQRLPSARYVSLIPLKRVMNEEKFAKKDRTPEGFKIIYRAPMEFYIRAVKIFSTFSAVSVGSLAVLKLATDNKYMELSNELFMGPLVTHGSDIWAFAAGFLAINTILMVFITKYPLRIYKKEKRYLAIYESVLPFGVSRFNFNAGEVKESKHFLNPWSLITFKIRSKTTLLLMDYFKTASEFHEMFEENK